VAAGPSAVPAWVTWSEDGLTALRERVPGAGLHETEGVPVLRRPSPDWRYQVRLVGLPDGRALLRTGDRSGTALDVSVAGGPFGPVDGWPERLAALPVDRVRVTARGVVAGVAPDPDEIVVWCPPDPPRVHRPPPGFLTRAVTATPSTVLICGSVPARRMRSVEHRAAVATLAADDGGSWQVDDGAHGGLADAWRGVLGGAVPVYDDVEVLGDCVVLTSRIGPLGDESTRILLRTARGAWRGARLGRDVPRATLPAAGAGVQVVSQFGKVLTANGRGAWTTARLREPVLRLVEGSGEPLPAAARIEILDAAYGDGGLLVVASVRVPGRSGLDRYGEAVAVLGTRNGNGRLVAFHGAAEPEAVSATWLAVPA
jgi:hypothetical protein